MSTFTATTQRRLSGITDYLNRHGIDGALIVSYENRRYYTGFTGSNGYVILTKNEAILITDKRYTTQAELQAPGFQLVECAANRLKLVAECIQKCGITSLVTEECMLAGEYFAIQSELPGVKITLEQEYFLEQRMVKDEAETLFIREAIRCSDRAFKRLIPSLRAGMSEKDLADELHYLANKEGAQALSFGTIVATGERGAMAHAEPSARKIERGEMVVVDFGVMKEGYVSDMTRTLLFGDIPQAHRRIFDIVAESQQAAFAAIRPGMLAREVEQAHRDVFLRENVESYALKGLGHGIGLEIHECPRIVIANETVLREGMIFTVEPGLYFPDDCGVRTEDVVRVTADGYEVLTDVPREIHID